MRTSLHLSIITIIICTFFCFNPKPLKEGIGENLLGHFYLEAKSFPTSEDIKAEPGGCNNLPTGDWNLIIHLQHGIINFHNGTWSIIGGDGGSGYRGYIQNCSFNQTTMAISWDSDKPVARHFTGSFDPKKNMISGTFMQKGLSKPLGWSAISLNKGNVRGNVAVGNPARESSNNPKSGNSNLVMSGSWNLLSGGKIGTSDERKIFYRGILVLSADLLPNSSYLSFGTKEILKDLKISNSAINFKRPLSGVTQVYQGIISGNTIEGTFEHGGEKYYWRAEKK